MTIEDLEIRLNNLEKAFIQSQKNNVSTVAKADTAPMIQQQASTNAGNIAANAEEIVNTQLGLSDTYETTLLNDETITQCQEALCEIYEMMLVVQTEEEE